MSETQVLPEEDLEVSEPDGFAHYVRIKALMEGGVVVALCGKRYVPTVVGGEVVDREVCPKCAELMGFLHAMHPEDS